MAQQVERLFVHCKELLTLAHGPAAGARRGGALRSVGLIEDGAIAVDDGRVVAVGTTAELRDAYHSRRELDLTGFVVLPGFVDSCVFPVPDLRGEDQGPDALIPPAVAVLEGCLARGTTSISARVVQEGLASSPSAVAEALAAARSRVDLEVRTTLRLVPGGRGGDPGPTDVEGGPLRELRGTEGCEVLVGRDGFPWEQAGDLFEASRAAGLRCSVAVGEGGAKHIRDALGVEVDALIDPLEITVADAERLAEHSTVAVLLAGGGAAQRPRSAPARPLVDAGCAVALATGCGSSGTPAESMVRAMGVAVARFGLTAEEAVHAATINGAAWLGADEQVGTLHPGKRANFVALDLSSYRSLGDGVEGGSAPLVVLDGEPRRATVRQRDPDV